MFVEAPVTHVYDLGSFNCEVLIFTASPFDSSFTPEAANVLHRWELRPAGHSVHRCFHPRSDERWSVSADLWSDILLCFCPPPPRPEDLPDLRQEGGASLVL